jgi:hypothetical protein
MTFTMIILAVTFLASVWIAVDLLGPGGSPQHRRASGKTSDRSGQTFFQPIARLIADADFEYLSGHDDLASRLTKSRGTVMRLYLVELRREFLEVWHVCRLLAPISPDPHFVSRLSRQYWSFHWTYATVFVFCLAPALTRKPAAVERLVSALSQVRAEARELLAVSDSALAMPSAA